MAKLPNITISYQVAEETHELNQTTGTTIQNLIQDGYDQKPHQYLFAGFKNTTNPSTPSHIKFQQATHQNPLVDNLHYVLAPLSATDLNNLYDKVQSILQSYGEPDLAFYQDHDEHWQLVIQLNRLLERAYAEKVSEKFNEILALNQFNVLKSVGYSTPIEPINTNGNTAKYIFSGKQKALNISQSYLDSLDIDEDDDTMTDNSDTPTTPDGYSKEQLEVGFKNFAADEYNQNAFKDADFRNDFWMSLLTTIDEMNYKQTFLDHVVHVMTGDQGLDVQNQYEQEIMDAEAKIKNNSLYKNIVKGIADYFPLYRGSKGKYNIPVHNLSDQLKNALGDTLVSDPKLKINDAANQITRIYSPYIIKNDGTNRNNIVIFNSLNGLWTHDDDLFHMLLTAVKPYHTKQDFERMMQDFADEAATSNRYIKPYSGSRYLLFNNGCLDVKTLKLYPLDSPLVRNLHFTNRSHLDLDYKPNPELPVIPNGKVDNGGDWTPKDFITAYGNNNPEQLQYFLFGLSLGLFGGHNFGVHFDIKGESRWGKSTLSEIFKNLYGSKQIAKVSYSNLNNRFVFNNYNPDTSVIWVSECNNGSVPLNDEQGTIIYDRLADSQTKFEVKGQADIIVDNPPQVYIDGTQYIQANNLNTGPYGRTLPYKLNNMNEKLRKQFYGNNINQFLSEPKVLQWIVWQMITAYRSMVPEYKMSSFQMNLSVQEDANMLPKVAKGWRNELTKANSDLSDWFINDVEPYLNPTTDVDDPDATQLHVSIVYNLLYDAYYARYNPFDTKRLKIKKIDRFQREFDQVIEQYGWRKIPIGSKNGREKTLRKKVSDYRNIHFDWNAYFDDNGKLDKLSDPTQAPEPFKRKRPNWFKLVKTDVGND